MRLALLAALVACSAEVEVKAPELPVANDETCRPERLRAIRDREAREAMASACLRRAVLNDPFPEGEELRLEDGFRAGRRP